MEIYGIHPYELILAVGWAVITYIACFGLRPTLNNSSHSTGRVGPCVFCGERSEQHGNRAWCSSCMTKAIGDLIEKGY